MNCTHSETIFVRLTSALDERLKTAVKQSTYKITMAAVIERGIILATEEMARMEAAKGAQ